MKTKKQKDYNWHEKKEMIVREQKRFLLVIWHTHHSFATNVQIILYIIQQYHTILVLH